MKKSSRELSERILNKEKSWNIFAQYCIPPESESEFYRKSDKKSLITVLVYSMYLICIKRLKIKIISNFMFMTKALNADLRLDIAPSDNLVEALQKFEVFF